MIVEKTNLAGCLLIKPTVFKDDRGSFFESYNHQTFQEKTGLKITFLQDNQSISQRGALRGIHLQTGEYAQSKLVRVIQGEVLDVAVDLRKESATFGKTFSAILNDVNNHQLFVPKGFGHGFITLSKTAIFAYKCDNYYHKASESGVIYNDPILNIDWRLDPKEFILSAKDKELPSLKNFKP